MVSAALRSGLEEIVATGDGADVDGAGVVTPEHATSETPRAMVRAVADIDLAMIRFMISPVCCDSNACRVTNLAGSLVSELGVGVDNLFAPVEGLKRVERSCDVVPPNEPEAVAFHGLELSGLHAQYTLELVTKVIDVVGFEEKSVFTVVDEVR